jgi:hypothetical protein
MRLVSMRTNVRIIGPTQNPYRRRIRRHSQTYANHPGSLEDAGGAGVRDLAEAFPPSHEGQTHRDFGHDGLYRTLRESVRIQMPAALQRLFDASNEFTGGHGPHDDTSVVLAERIGTT